MVISMWKIYVQYIRDSFQGGDSETELDEVGEVRGVLEVVGNLFWGVNNAFLSITPPLLHPKIIFQKVSILRID